MPWAWWLLVLVIAANAAISFGRARRGVEMNMLPPVATAALGLLGAWKAFPYGGFGRYLLIVAVTAALVWLDKIIWEFAYTLGRGGQRS